MLPVKHQINLYLPRFRPPKLSQDVWKFIKAFVITLLVLITLTLVLYIAKSYLASQVEQLTQEQTYQTRVLSDLNAQLPSMSVDKNLEASIVREKELLANQKRAISFLRQDSISEKSSFTPLVAQLSEQSVKGIWLSKIEIMNQGNDIQLYGFAQNPNFISQYIAALGEKNAYRGRTFKQITVSQSETRWKQFFLSTKQQAANTSVGVTTAGGSN